MRRALADLEPSFAEGRPLEALRQASEVLARFRSDMPQGLEFVGDLQRHGWEGIDTLTLPEELRVQVVQVGDPDAVNRGLSLQVRGRDRQRRGAVIMEGEGSPLPLVVHDQLGNEEEPAEPEVAQPEDVVELPYRAADRGWVRRKVSFAAEPDGLAPDNILYDTFYMAPDIPVVLLEPHPGRESFLRTTFFVDQALRPSSGEAAKDSRYLPRMTPVDEAVDVLRDLAGRDAVVVIPALATWPAELPAAVAAFVREGGGAVFFAGPNLPRAAYVESWGDLLPAAPSCHRLSSVPWSRPHTSINVLLLGTSLFADAFTCGSPSPIRGAFSTCGTSADNRFSARGRE